MRFLRLFAVLVAYCSAAAQVSTPQINLSGNVGATGLTIPNSGTIQLTSDGNFALSDFKLNTSAVGCKFTSSVPLTATRTVTYPPGNFLLVCENATEGGQALNITNGSGAYCLLPNAPGVLVPMWFDGTNCALGPTTRMLTGAYADNSHDDTAAFNSCMSLGAKCMVPVGTYRVNAGTQLYVGAGSSLIGMGGPSLTGGVRLVGTLSGGCSIATNPADSNPGLYSEIAYITFVGNGTGDAGFCPLQSASNAPTPPQSVYVHDNVFMGHTYCVNATSLSYDRFSENSCEGPNALGSIGLYLHPPASGNYYLELSEFSGNRISSYDKGASIQAGSRIQFNRNDINLNRTVGVEFQNNAGKLFFDQNNIESQPTAFLFDPSGSQVVAGVAIANTTIYLPGVSNSESAFKMTGTNYVSQVNLNNNLIFTGDLRPTTSVSLANVNPGTPGSNQFTNTGLIDTTDGAHLLPSFGGKGVLQSNVAMTTASRYYAGPTTPKLAAGNWLVTATVTVEMVPASMQANPTQFTCRLYDGTSYSAVAATDISPTAGVNRSQSLTVTWLFQESASATITSYCQSDYPNQYMLATTLFGSQPASYIMAIPIN
jgi:hypothetical protein